MILVDLWWCLDEWGWWSGTYFAVRDTTCLTVQCTLYPPPPCVQAPVGPAAGGGDTVVLLATLLFPLVFGRIQAPGAGDTVAFGSVFCAQPLGADDFVDLLAVLGQRGRVGRKVLCRMRYDIYHSRVNSVP